MNIKWGFSRGVQKKGRGIGDGIGVENDGSM
jgi:hypothetical protein